ncbi:MAG: TIGR00725 family protein [Clostridia bacterium]|nr:TIGR00725 family protein [Clostridia bacterium]
MSDRRKVIAVIGNKKIEEGGIRYRLAYETGKILVDNGFRVQTGGLDGVMRAVMQGARDSKNYREGDTVAIIPSFDVTTANEYADIVIPTGIDMMRNALVANADAVVGVGGGAGTLCEYAFAWSLKRLIIAYKNSGGWSEKLAGTRLDDTVRYADIDPKEDRVFSVTEPEEMIKILKEKIEHYDIRHTGIK